MMQILRAGVIYFALSRASKRIIPQALLLKIR